MILRDLLTQRLARHSASRLDMDYPEAGVLVPVSDNAGTPEILFTLRSSNLSTHRGQVAFPGGKRDSTDPSIAFTALREAHEEIGLPPEQVELIAPLSQVVSRYGIVAFASSLDQGGVITVSAEDAALTLQAIAGFDPQDSTSVDAAVPDYRAALDAPLAGLKVGIVREFFGEGLTAEVEGPVREAVATLQKLGATVREVSLPGLPLSVPTYYVVAPAECSSNLARFDGVRYGHRCDNPKDLRDLYMRSRAEGFGVEVKRRIMTGTYVLSAGYYDAYYLKAQKVRALITRDFQQAFGEVDLLLGPTSPTVAFGLGDKTSDPITMYLNDIYTIGANLAGLPAMSIPCGFAGGLPVGVQLIGPHFGEARLLNAAHRFQQETDWHLKAPAGFDAGFA